MLILTYQDTSRPLGQHRPSFSSSLPRQSYSRPSYSSSLGTSNPLYRIARRKSSTLSPSAINAAVNAVEGDDDGAKGVHRRSIQSRAALGSSNPGSYPSPPNSLPQSAMMARSNTSGGSAVVDGPSLASMSDKANKNRTRRASDGSTLSSKKKGGNGDLKCETCGKAYKHSSCLTKHLLVSPLCPLSRGRTRSRDFFLGRLLTVY